MKKINDNYPKYILTIDDDLNADLDGIKKINIRLVIGKKVILDCKLEKTKEIDQLRMKF